MEEKGTLALNPSDTVRHAFQQEYIQDADLWMEALKAHNLTSHAYKQSVADEISGKIREHYFALLTQLHGFFKEQL